MPDVETAAESSTAATEVTPIAEIPKDGEAYNEWRKTGKTPEAAAAKPKGDSATPKTSGSETASEAAKQDKPVKPRDNAADRVKELLEDLKAAGLTPAELKTFKKQAAAAESGTKAETPKAPEAPKAPVKPKVDDFETYDLYEAAVDKWHDDTIDFRAERKLEERDARTRAEASARATTEKLDTAAKRYGEGSKEMITETAGTIFNDPKIPGPVKALIDDSPVIADLLYTLGSKDGELTAFVELARTNPGAALRKAVLMEHLIAEELAKGDKTAASSETAGRASDGKFTAPPAKKVTDAPPPARESGGRGAAPQDPVDRASSANDFETFRREANARDLARSKGQ